MSAMRLLLTLPFLFMLSLSPVFANNTAPSYVELRDAPTITVDWSKGDTQGVTLHGSRTLVFENGVKGGKYMLVITQDAHGSRKIILPASVRWTGKTPPTNPPLLTTTAGRTDYLGFFFNGVTYDVLSLAQDY